MKRVCVIGWPIKHSRSPLIHNYWIGQFGIDAHYDLAAVPPEGLETFLGTMADVGLAGCNVTVPHKEAVYNLVTVEDDFTRRLGAVNTVYLKEGVAHGTNTDGIGFLQNLKTGSPQWDATRGPATVLGAGGAARAVLAMLCDAGVPEIRITNRTPERAEQLAAQFSPHCVVVPWQERADALKDCTLLVNSTSLGMSGAPSLDLDLERLPVGATVNDIVYAPLKTDLLVRAEARGNVVVDGLGMLLHQAVPGFALWFGRTPEVTPELRALVVRDLETT